MANPTKPTIDYSYTGFQQEQQSSPFPGTQIDNDLAELKRAADDTIDALADVRRSDGAVANESIGFDQLKPELDAFGVAAAEAAASAAEAAAYVGEAEELLNDIVVSAFGEPLVIVATGQSNLRLTRAAIPPRDWPANIKLWNVDELDENSIGTAFEPLTNTNTAVSWEMANEISRAFPRRPIYIINIARGSQDVSHWNNGHNYAWDAGTAAADPGAGKVRANNADPTLVTELYANEVDAFGGNKTTSFSLINVTADRIDIIDTSGDGIWTYSVAGNSTDHGGWRTIPVSYVSHTGGGALSGGVKLKFNPDMGQMLLNNVPPALAAIGVDKIDVYGYWQGEADAMFNNGARFMTEWEQHLARLTSQPWFPPETPIIVFGINNGENTGNDYNRVMNLTLQKVVAADTDRRIFVNTAAIGAAHWGDSNSVHLIDDDAQEIAGKLAARSWLSSASRKVSQGSVTDPETGYDHFIDGLLVPSKTVFTLPSAATVPGAIYHVTDLAGGAGPVQSDGEAWRPLAPGFQDYDEETSGVVSWLNWSPLVELSATLTANQGLSLSVTGVPEGAVYRFHRTGGGGFVWNIGSGPLHQLNQGEVCEIIFRSGAWTAGAKWRPVVPSDFALTLLDDANDATARATLGANDASNLNAGTVAAARLPAYLAQAALNAAYAPAWADYPTLPTITSDGAAPAVTHTTQTARYVQSGSTVRVKVRLITSAASGGTGNVTIANALPVAPDYGGYVPISCRGWATDENPQWMQVTAGSTTVSLHKVSTADPNGDMGASVVADLVDGASSNEVNITYEYEAQ